MYKSDCEALLNRTFDELYTLCMDPGTRLFYANQNAFDLQYHFKAIDSILNICYGAGSPIVWRKDLNDTVFVEYLVHMYSHGGCDHHTPRVVTRIAPYIEWFKEVLQ